jgi:dihydroorotate dehydrogenase (NAD+) catalytic subunit
MDHVMKLEVRIGNLELATPLIGASGIFGYGLEHGDLLDYDRFGAVVTKTITLGPRDGNPPPRIVDVGCGIINSIGLENVGSAVFLSEKLPQIDLPCKVFVSIGGDTIDQYGRLAGLLAGAAGIDALELNVSCPNVDRGGIAFGRDADSTGRVVRAVRSETELAILVKLPPLISGIEGVCQAAVENGADALTIANTYPAMAIDRDSGRPVMGGISGGLSGGAIKHVSLLLVYKVAGIVGVPVVGSGGIESPDDAIEYILAGASAFQIGSCVLRDTEAPARIIDGLLDYMRSKDYAGIDDFRGRAAD